MQTEAEAMATDQQFLISILSPSVIAQCLCIGLSLPLLLRLQGRSIV